MQKGTKLTDMKVRRIMSPHNKIFHRKPKRIRQHTRINELRSFSVQKPGNLIFLWKHVWKWNFRDNSTTKATRNIRPIGLTKDPQELHEDSYKNVLRHERPK